MEKEMIIEMFTMKVMGHTYQEIGEKYGCSKQYIEQEIKRVLSGSNSRLQRYPKRKALVKYISDNKLSLNEFSELVEVPYNNILTFMRGESQSMKTAINIANYTGLSLDEIFGR